MDASHQADFLHQTIKTGGMRKWVKGTGAPNAGKYGEAPQEIRGNQRKRKIAKNNRAVFAPSRAKSRSHGSDSAGG